MNTYRRLFAFVPEKKALVWWSALLAVVSTVLTILPFYYLHGFLKDLLVKGDTALAFRRALAVVALTILQGGFYFLALWCSHLLAFRLETNLRKAGIQRLMRASFSFFDTHPSGQVRKLIDDNAALTHTVVAHLIPDTVAAFLSPLLLIALMLILDPAFAVVLVVSSLIALYQMKLMMGEREFMRRYELAMERVNAESVEYVRGMPVVKVFRTQVKAFKTFYEAITDYARLAYDYSLSCRPTYVSFQVLFNLFIAFTLPVAAILLRGGAAPAETLTRVLFFAAFAGAMFTCFMRVMYTGMYQFQAKSVVDKLGALFDEMDRNAVPRGSETVFPSFDIEFRDVCFRYEDRKILDGLSFALPEKKTYALVGTSGGGKTTVAKLISGFYPIESGQILIGGKPISSYAEEALNRRVAFVFQNARLMKKTIYENVLMGRPDAARDEVMAALRLAQCSDILDKFPERENTKIGAEGVYLSGGETQRIAIARAILKNADIIILDEASAAADPENEHAIQRAFSNLMKNKTVIMIAHRLSSIRGVDEILLMDEGRIIERGTDEALMRANGRYAHLQALYAKANDWRVAHENH